MRDDLEELLAKLDCAAPQRGRVWFARRPLVELGAFRDERTHHNLVITFGVDQLDRAGKEPLHLILKTGAFAVASPAAIFHAELVHELIERAAEHQLAAAASSRLPSTPTLRAGAGCCRRAAAPASRRP